MFIIKNNLNSFIEKINFLKHELETFYQSNKEKIKYLFIKWIIDIKIISSVLKKSKLNSNLLKLNRYFNIYNQNFLIKFDI